MPPTAGHEADAHLRQVLAALPAAAYTTDAGGLVTYFNSAAVDFAGRQPQIGRDRWCVTWRLYTSEGVFLPHDQCPMAVALKENRTIRGVRAVAERPDGTRVPFMPHPTPIQDAAGAVTGGFNLLLDLSQAGRAEALARVGAADLRRRLRTTLEIVRTILEEAHAKAGSGDARAALSAVLRRVGTLAAAQGVLLGAQACERVDGWDLLSSVCLIAQREIDGNIDLACEACAGDLDAETAITVALIAQELIGDAARDATTASQRVAVRISLRRQGRGHALCVEADRAPAGARITTGTIGSGLVAALTRQLGGTLEVQPTPASGISCTVRFPDPRQMH